jgi:hypothetical protein
MHGVGKLLFTDVIPAMRNRIAFGTIGRLRDHADVLGHLQVRRGMPGCPIDLYHDKRVRAILGNLGQEDVHHRIVRPGHYQTTHGTGCRVNCGNRRQRFTDDPVRHAWTQSRRCPAALHRTDAPNARRILHQQHDRAVIIQVPLLQHRLHLVGNIFLSSRLRLRISRLMLWTGCDGVPVVPVQHANDGPRMRGLSHPFRTCMLNRAGRDQFACFGFGDEGIEEGAFLLRSEIGMGAARRDDRPRWSNGVQSSWGVPSIPPRCLFCTSPYMRPHPFLHYRCQIGIRMVSSTLPEAQFSSRVVTA